MSILVLAEHDNSELKAATLNAISAANQLEGDVHVLVAGSGCQNVADEASTVDGVAKVLLADATHLEHQIAEELTPLVMSLADGYSHIKRPWPLCTLVAKPINSSYVNGGSSLNKLVIPRVNTVLSIP